MDANRYGAPVVLNPKDIRAHSADPCGRLLTSGQTTSLGYGSPSVPHEESVPAPACIWKGERPDRSFRADVMLGGDYFVDTYRARLMPIFKPTVIAGLPAVEQQTEEGPSLCTITIGIAPGQALETFTSIDQVHNGVPAIDPCAEGRRVAEAIVSTLPPL